MTILFAILEVLVLVVAARVANRSESPPAARLRASYGMGMAGVVALGQVLWSAFNLPTPEWSVHWVAIENPHAWVPAFSLMTCVIGFTAVVLSPIRATRPKTFARILLLIAAALAFLVIRHPLGLAVVWATSAFIAWLELRDVRRMRKIERLFAIYQVPSVAAVTAGAVLLINGHLNAGLALVVAGVAIREAVIPLHSWFVPFVQHAPMGLVVAFFAPQLGVYAHLELIRAELPHQLGHVIAALGAATAVIAASLGVAQTNARRALAFLVMSQTGLVAFGLDTNSSVAQLGALLTWQVIGVATAGFAMTLASLEARRGDLSMQVPAGSFTRTPRMAVAFLFMGFASVGLPLTLGFVAEDLLVQGSVEEFPILGFALIVATALNGISVMRAFFTLFSGSSKHIGESDLTRRESGVLTVVMATLLLTGMFPGFTVRGLEQVTERQQRAPSISQTSGQAQHATPPTSPATGEWRRSRRGCRFGRRRARPRAPHQPGPARGLAPTSNS